MYEPPLLLLPKVWRTCDSKICVSAPATGECLVRSNLKQHCVWTTDIICRVPILVALIPFFICTLRWLSDTKELYEY